jgi:hypothetical protein
MLVAISITALAGPALLSMFAMSDTLLYPNGSTTMQFVLLIMTGDAVDHVDCQFNIVGHVCLTGVFVPQDIGLLFVDESEAHSTVGYPLLNPKEKIWVRFTGGHFDVVAAVDRVFQLWDPFNQDPVEWIPMKEVDPLYGTLCDLTSDEQ